MSASVFPRIRLSAPLAGETEIENIRHLIEDGQLVQSNDVLGAFEDEIRAFANVGHALALISGTAALHLALKVLGVGPGDAVVCPTFTFIASANPIRYVGATPIFVDSDESWTLDPDLLEQALVEHPEVEAVISVDIYGKCCDYGRITEICSRHRVRLIQDAAESLGSTWGTAQAGGQGDVAIFSFNGNKIMTTSGGGMLVSDDKELIARAKRFAEQGKAKEEPDEPPRSYYLHEEIGFNYRLSTVLSEFGRAQLARLNDWIDDRRRIRARYEEELGDVDGIDFMPADSFGIDNAWLPCIVLNGFPIGRDELWQALRDEGIESRAVWNPMHLQPPFEKDEIYGGAVSERLFASGLCLPSGSGLRPDEQDEVMEVIRREAARGS